MSSAARRSAFRPRGSRELRKSPLVGRQGREKMGDFGRSRAREVHFMASSADYGTCKGGDKAHQHLESSLQMCRRCLRVRDCGRLREF